MVCAQAPFVPVGGAVRPDMGAVEGGCVPDPSRFG